MADGYIRWSRKGTMRGIIYYWDYATRDLRVGSPNGPRSAIAVGEDFSRMEDILRHIGYTPEYPQCLQVPEGL